MRQSLVPAVLACLALAACDPAGSAYSTGSSSGSASAAAIGSADCGAESYQYLVGGPLALALDLPYSGPKRYLGPDQSVTKDYNPHRLTVTSTDGETVGRIICS
ncbi:I78 family peptidase inhibitor [Mangrovicoccus sp. HB161399]|uniref:I78 family peptidase inhibitor n=1 Tax=Mangrovicoccus sp. HB161399 TaxID=2720392 RepID=UPI0015574BB3|nr:I78 family peptidase inhibitor [Mangrovicoccus sp. HB161399]